MRLTRANERRTRETRSGGSGCAAPLALRLEDGKAGEGASQSLQDERAETVEQRNRNFRDIQRGRAPEKFSSRGNAIRGDRGRLPLQAASDIHLPCLPLLRGVFFGISGRIAGERSRPGKILRRITPGAHRRGRRGPPPSRMRIYPFLHRNGERGPQGPGKRPSGVER